MGFWTSGPVVGSLVVFVVASHTIGANPSPAFWVHEYKISGIVGLVVFVIAAVWLRELSRGLRDQLMVTIHDRALIEAKAKGIDVEASLRNLLRPVAKAGRDHLVARHRPVPARLLHGGRLRFHLLHDRLRLLCPRR